MDLKAIQKALRDAELHGWLFCDHHHRDAIAYRMLGIARARCTRPWYYLVPATGRPSKLVSRIEKGILAALPGVEYQYSSWREQREHLEKMLKGMKRLAMQYSPRNDLPSVDLVDSGTVELVKSYGVEVGSSADLVQWFDARWSSGALASHLEAGKAVHAILREAFAMIRDAVKTGKTTTEYDLQQEIVRRYDFYGLEATDPPIVAVNANSADPHYEPTPSGSTPICVNDFVLIDVWAKRQSAGAVYFDVTWTGFVGLEVPRRYTEIFEVVREARDTALDYLRHAVRKGQEVRGYEVDDVARAVITRCGYGEKFLHRTGHSISEEVHGKGANLDNYETHDTRRIIPGTCFSIEPGVYLQEFGVRSEINVYVEERDVRVTGEVQEAIVPILAAY